MKRVIYAVCLLSLMIGSICFSKELTKVPAYVSTSAQEIKEVAPDVAFLTFGVETRDKTIQKATNSNKILSNNLIKVLKKTFGENGTIQTSSISINPIYSTQKDMSTITSYRANMSLTVKTTKLDLVTPMIEQALKTGVNKVNNLTFELENPQPICNELYTKASLNAKEQANVVAKSFDTSILGIRKINATCSSSNSNNQAYRMYASNMEDSTSSPYKIEEGTIQVRAQIDAEFNLK